MPKTNTEFIEEFEKLNKQISELREELRVAKETIAIKESINPLFTAGKQSLIADAEKTADKSFRILMEKMHEGAATLNQDGTILYCNSCFANMVNLPLSKVLGTPFKNYIEDSSKEHFDTLFKQGWKEHVKDEIYLKPHADIIMPMGISANTLELDNKLALSIIITDVTNQNKIQEELIQKNEELEKANKAIAAQNEELLQKNQEIAISQYNKRFLTEFSEQFSSYKTHNEFFNSLVQYIYDTTQLDYVFVGRLEQNEKGDFFIHTVALTVFGKLVENITYPLPDGPCEEVMSGAVYAYPENCQNIFPKNQTLVQFNVEGYIGCPLFDLQGKAMGLLSVMHEKKIENPETATSILRIVAKRAEIEMERITQEELLKESNITLQNLNKELTFQIEEKEKGVEELSSANTNVKELEELIAHKESILAILSHDLRSPLAGIIGTAEFLQANFEEMDPLEVKEMLTLLYESSQNELNMLDYLVEWARVKYASQVFSPEKIELAPYVQKAFDLLNESAIKNGMALHNEVEGGIHVFADGKMVLSILQNLLSNAIKHSPPCETITVSAERKEDKIIVQIKDTGIGMSKETLEKLFIPQMDTLTEERKENKGAGIGLLLVKGFLEKNDGEIWVESEEGKGSSFYFTLPIDKPTA